MARAKQIVSKPALSGLSGASRQPGKKQKQNKKTGTEHGHGLGVGVGGSGKGAGARRRNNMGVGMNDDDDDGDGDENVEGGGEESDAGYLDISEFDYESDESPAELDETRAMLEELQSAMERGARDEKRGNFEKEMERRVRMDEKRLAGMVREEERRLETEQEEFRAQFASLIKSALSPMDGMGSGDGAARSKDDKSIIPEDISPDNNPLYIKTRALLQSSKSLVTDVENIVDYTSKLEVPLDFTEEWEKDCAEARRLIKTGREASEAKIEKLLFYEKGMSPRRGARGNGQKRKREFEDDENLQIMFEMGRDSEDDDYDEEALGWGFVAHQAEKGMKVLTKALP